jgi:PAS domain S-box-containing protein
MAFTSFVSLYGFTNMLGHFLKLAAFYLIYRAILVTGLKEPFDLIFRDLKQAEEDLRKSRDTLEEKVRERTEELCSSVEQFRTLAENSPDTIIRYDRECRRIYVNPAFEQTTGISANQALNRQSDGQWQADLPLDDYKIRLRQVAETGAPCEIIMGWPDQNGDPATHSLRMVPERNQEGEITGVLVMGRNITELKRAEEELHIQAAELEQEVAERQMAQEKLQKQTVLLEKSNERLEQRVQERTHELNERNAEVQQAYDDLKRVQGQLLQQDKMASVGQLAAGVAHEINNPMGFIISNLSSLGKYVEKVTAYLDSDENILAGCDPVIHQMAVKERQKYKIDHICRDMPELIAESSDGAQRVRQIVQDLKSFSRVDGTEFANADINEGLESTLSIAWNELKYKTTVTKEYGQLPYVWCNMGQLNQVFLNILVNAAHAIDVQGEIRIKTWSEGEAVSIAISDSGGGIQPENLKRIFDPFFTTKEVGKGTGLGLAIAYDIITNKHNGRIDVQSEVGRGTAFTITLPVLTAGDSPL